MGLFTQANTCLDRTYACWPWHQLGLHTGHCICIELVKTPSPCTSNTARLTDESVQQ